LAATNYPKEGTTYKIWASTKHWRRQNVGVDKTLALTKYLHQKNIGITKCSACAEASPYCFDPAKSAAADFSQTSLMISLKMLSSPRAVTKCAVAALLLWAYSLPHCTGSFVPARHAENVTNIGVDKYRRPPRFHYILPNYSSQYPISVHILITSKLSRHRDPTQRSLSVPME
jgi:hypothetical protein